ncbi:PQQ-binding-like beta-propeller repeat protein [Nonomuraea angiospora]|uniref:Outer membrane protein assembly factor BamB n=1 Tax=Nonomuraea angiospora TaxID=46172 RepID=A0ABR9M4U3_9ACTN|nr:PQQ-binding-like beta-propeller repeat protein [Nonomuraea angiospora]MBE1587926.1 outer membrane protein assembly factor BamB [Nonomuraea angiospora]
MIRRRRIRESWVWHALLCLAFLAILAPPAPRFPVERPGPAIPAGTRSLLWQAHFRGDWPGALFLDDVLVLTHGERVEGRNAVTGQILWSFSASDIGVHLPPDESLEATGDYVVAVAQRDDEDSEVVSPGAGLLAFNGRTGTVLWNLTSGFYGSEMPDPYFTYLGSGGERVLIEIPSAGVVRALDAVDGQPRWESTISPGCHVESGNADESVAAYLMNCAGHFRLRVLGVSTGRFLWEREVFPSGTPVIGISGRAIGVESDNAFTVYDTDGRRLYEHTAGETCVCLWAATAEGLVVVRQDDVSKSMVADAVDRRSRRVTPIRGEAGEFETVEAVDGRIYGRRRLGATLQGSAIVTVDPATAKQTPVVTFPIYEDVIGISRYALLLAPDSNEDTKSLLAYRTVAPPMTDPGRTARGGVETRAWPDTCSLIPPSALAAEFPKARYRPLPLPGPPGLGLSTPIGCDLVPGDAKHPVLTISVLWVGATAGEAETILQTIAAEWDEKDPSRISSPEPWMRLYVSTYMTDETVVRVGGALVRMDGAGNRDVAVRLARALAGSLRAAA